MKANISPSIGVSSSNSNAYCLKSTSHAQGGCSTQYCPYGMEFNGSTCVQSNTPLTTSLYKPALTDAEVSAIESNGGQTVLVNGYGKVPRPTIALYHGGIVGEAKTNATVYKSYLQTVINWVKDNAIDVVFVSLSSYNTSKNPSFPYYADPSFLAENFLNLLPPNVKAGAVAYVRPKDSGWAFDPMAPGGEIGTEKGQPCEFVTPNSPCPADCASPCPQKGCPNALAQAVKYLKAVNDKASGDHPKFSILVFDGEDAGNYASACGFEVGQKAANLYGIELQFGFAKALEAGVINDSAGNPLTDYVMPETYWYMNDNWPCTGGPWQMAQRAPVCTTWTSYQRYKNQPVEFMKFLIQSDACGYGDGQGFTSLKNNVESDPTRIWPLFSLEKLSSLYPTSSCLAMEYGVSVNANGVPDISEVCGTFDGFGTWEWGAFLQFISLFAYQFGISQVGIYESQFLPYSSNGSAASWITPISPVPPLGPKSACPKDEDCVNCAAPCKTNADCTTLLSSGKCMIDSSKTYSSYCNAKKVCHISSS